MWKAFRALPFRKKAVLIALALFCIVLCLFDLYQLWVVLQLYQYSNAHSFLEFYEHSKRPYMSVRYENTDLGHIPGEGGPCLTRCSAYSYGNYLRVSGVVHNLDSTPYFFIHFYGVLFPNIGFYLLEEPWVNKMPSKTHLGIIGHFTCPSGYVPAFVDYRGILHIRSGPISSPWKVQNLSLSNMVKTGREEIFFPSSLRNAVGCVANSSVRFPSQKTGSFSFIIQYTNLSEALYDNKLVAILPIDTTPIGAYQISINYSEKRSAAPYIKLPAGTYKLCSGHGNYTTGSFHIYNNVPPVFLDRYHQIEIIKILAPLTPSELSSSHYRSLPHIDLSNAHPCFEFPWGVFDVDVLNMRSFFLHIVVQFVFTMIMVGLLIFLLVKWCGGK